MKVVSVVGARPQFIKWARCWLALACKPLQQYGILRMMRDVFQVRGQVFFH